VASVKPPVLHQEQQDEQAGDDAHDQHGGRTQPASSPPSSVSTIEPRVLTACSVSGASAPGERAGLVQPGRDLREDLALAAQEPGNHDPQDQGDDADGEHDDQRGTRPAG
jgi:hypothetical protein